MAIQINHLGFLTPGNYPEDAPFDGLESTLRLFAFGEQLGFDSAWVRQRHLENGISSAAAFLAAASQRTSTIGLGTAVIPVGYESPYRLGEDLATVDVLSRGRLNVGLSAGSPPHLDLLGPAVFDGDWQNFDFSYERVLRLRRHLAGEYLGAPDAIIEFPGGRVRPRLQPHAPGLTERLWYGGGSLRSAEWAARNHFNLLLGNVTSGEDTDDFLAAQLRQYQLYRSLGPAEPTTRVALGRVIVPLDSATPAIREKYLAYAAARDKRVGIAHGPRRTLFLRDIVGTSEEILATLRQDPLLPLVSELRLELPYAFEEREYRQILSDVATRIAPALGWRPTSRTAEKVA